MHGLAGDAQIEKACAQLKRAGAPQAEFLAVDLRHPAQIAERLVAFDGNREAVVADPEKENNPACSGRNLQRLAF